MHPDRKIGIAMGILLVGVVAALFFRNEPLPEESGLSAERERELNQQLRDRDVSLSVGPATTPETTTDEEISWSLNQMHQQLKNHPADLLPEHRKQSPENTAPRQQPSKSPITQDSATHTSQQSAITIHNTPDQRSLASTSNLSANDQPVFPNSADAKPTADRPTTAQSHATAEPEYMEYTVQFGDTLSGIAHRFLGAHHRYQEIYEANKDRMKSPDQLKVGKALRIPRSLH